ncbi:MAG TPA: phosphatidylglycerol lysyltransferase domain-containing protein [Pseudonocardiaceae bacterium]|nr:phosphatidylglycerol lysyltransferase domain-containing protein [Pseudonocardiaceae bacterium]
MRRHVLPFGVATIAAGIGVGVVALRGAPPAWLGLPSHGLLDGSPARPHAALLAVLLVLLGWGLTRRRQVAFGIVVLLLCVLALDLRQHVEYGLACLTAAGALTVLRPACPAVPDRSQVHTAIRYGGLTLLAAVLFGAAAHLHIVPRIDMGSALLLVALVTIGILLRAASAPAPSGDAERSRVRRMVAAPGADTLAPFALRSDKTYLFSTDGSAAVGYRVLLGVAVVGGDPVGDPAAFADVLARFHALCARKGWRPAVLGARDEIVTLWAAHGMRSVGIGDEVLLDVAPFGLGTRRLRNVRQAVRRTYNAGVRTAVLAADEIPAPLRAEMTELSTQWLGRARERGFSMILDRLLDVTRPDGLFVVAFDADDRLVGFQRYLPVGDHGTDRALSLDVMRRTKDRLNGLNERMIVDVVEYARQHGVDHVSLNFAAFRTLLDRGAGRTTLEQVSYRMLHLLDPLIQVESLYLFNAKFRPGYVRRNVLLGSWPALPIVLVALLGLEFALPYDRRRHTAPVPVVEVAEAPAGLPEGHR